MMSAPPPIPFAWNGEAMVPKLPRLADKHFVVGESYTLVPHEDRSRETHNHFFASVHEAWLNLPERYAERFPSAEHLRKWALVRAVYRDERSIVSATPEEALALAAFIRPLDGFAVITVNDCVVTVYTAKSQSMRAMGKKVFQESKEAVFRVLSDLIGVEPGELARNVGKAA